MHNITKTFIVGFGKVFRDPRKAIYIFKPSIIKKYLQNIEAEQLGGNSWISTADGLNRKEYSSYELYIAHQKSKLKHLDLSEYDNSYSAVLAGRLKELKVPFQGKNVLCLAARIGTEVKAFHSLGAFAVGIDLNPGKDNAYVLPGDFHCLQFPDNSVDAVFTNSLDHAFNLGKVMEEVVRVLKHGGMFVVEAVVGIEEGVNPGLYESMSWTNIGELVKIIEKRGLSLKSRKNFDNPWKGEQLIFNKPQ